MNTLPIMIRYTKQQIVDAINNSNLPLCVIEEILCNIYTEVKIKAEDEYQRAAKEIQQEGGDDPPPSVRKEDCDE